MGSLNLNEKYVVPKCSRTLSLINTEYLTSYIRILHRTHCLRQAVTLLEIIRFPKVRDNCKM